MSKVRIVLKSNELSYSTPWYEETSSCSMQRFMDVVQLEPEDLTVILERRENTATEQKPSLVRWPDPQR